jgi:hypothetical protein
MTGEVYNRGYEMAFNTKLLVNFCAPNSTVPIVSSYSLEDIDVHNLKQVAHPFC